MRRENVKLSVEELGHGEHAGYVYRKEQNLQHFVRRKKRTWTNLWRITGWHPQIGL
jgi:hypothetical protein